METIGNFIQDQILSICQGGIHGMTVHLSTLTHKFYDQKCCHKGDHQIKHHLKNFSCHTFLLFWFLFLCICFAHFLFTLLLSDLSVPVNNVFRGG